MHSYQYQTQDSGFSIVYQKALVHTMPKSHFHQSYELYYLLSGERDFFIKDRILKIEEGDIIIIRPNVLHKTANGNPSEHEKIIMNFMDALAPGLAGEKLSNFLLESHRDYVLIKKHSALKRKIYPIFQEILEEIQREQGVSPIYLQALLIQLLVNVNRHLEQHSQPLPQYISAAHERVSEIVQYINQHYFEAITLSCVADEFYISPSYLSRIFKEATEFSFVEYVNHVRVKEAIFLLKNTRLKSYVIGKKVGFSSVTHYGRVFKEVTGNSPLYYRNMVL